jgi:hypothetical protein
MLRYMALGVVVLPVSLYIVMVCCLLLSVAVRMSALRVRVRMRHDAGEVGEL